jgi:hypothetical protein
MHGRIGLYARQDGTLPNGTMEFTRRLINRGGKSTRPLIWLLNFKRANFMSLFWIRHLFWELDANFFEDELGPENVNGMSTTTSA